MAPAGAAFSPEPDLTPVSAVLLARGLAQE